MAEQRHQNPKVVSEVQKLLLAGQTQNESTVKFAFKSTDTRTANGLEMFNRLCAAGWTIISLCGAVYTFQKQVE